MESEILKVTGLPLPRLSRFPLLRVVGLARPRVAGTISPGAVGQDALLAGPNLVIQSSCSAFSLAYGHEELKTTLLLPGYPDSSLTTSFRE